MTETEKITGEIFNCFVWSGNNKYFQIDINQVNNERDVQRKSV